MIQRLVRIKQMAETQQMLRAKLPEVTHRTELSTRDVVSIADHLNLTDLRTVMPVWKHFLLYLPFMGGLVLGVFILLNGHSPAWLLPASVLCYTPVMVLGYVDKTARRAYVQHWITTGQLYPHDWRYDLRTKIFARQLKKEAIDGNSTED